ncbi:uncharacterized protein LOC122827218 [Gambusia affinis]|uniref:uncharacterized protein LOC122827218 n=1 Tax=Gambusia affinis TaxID=33528 RepID=UPI001CDB67CF|nr:uncharacterized protein LOC122827218 [Gambusia affinis]XP_043965845.1 uncharacterized protein LOC122827218 [Gambusia affinis]XP_043965846.1 uncharacterized protein LOC122827218 [Gambusia affinis]
MYLWAKKERKEPERKEPERKEPERKEPERKEPERKKPKRKEPERKEPERKEPERKEPERKEPERKEPERKEPERKKPKRKEPERKEPERKEPERKEPERKEPERKEPERKEPERKEPERKKLKRKWLESPLSGKIHGSKRKTELPDVERKKVPTYEERTRFAGVHTLRDKLRKYSCSLTFDSNTVHRKLKLSDNGRKVTHVSKALSYPYHPDRFDGWWPQLLCSDGLTGRCYWEVEWCGVVYVSVSYRGIRRRGYRNCMFGWNDQSWSLRCCDINKSYSVWHNNKRKHASSGSCSRVAVYVDCPAGILSFYRVSSGSLVHLYTFRITFTEPIYPGFGFRIPGSSVSLCQDLKPKLVEMQTDDSTLVEAPSSFRPQVETDNWQVSYRFQCPGPGVFECALTGLVFVVTQPAKLCYKIIQWDESILQPTGKVPAGPLYSISCSPEAVCGLHLPHCQDTDMLPSEGLLSVVHVFSDGLNFLEPLKITDTHVVVRISDFSAFGLVWDFLKRFIERKDPVPSQVLLYLGPLKPRARNQKLYVFLLPRNIPMYEVSKDRRNCKFISSTSNCKLIKDQRYILTCPRASQLYKIQPKSAEFDLSFGNQYHPTFEVRLPINTEEVVIIIKDEAETVVWEYDVDLAGHSEDDVQSGVTVQSESPNLKVDLLNILDELNEEEFKRFKWFLRNGQQTSGFKLKESAERRKVVDQLLQQYSPEEVLQAMKKTLKSMGRNDLVERLQKL